MVREEEAPEDTATDLPVNFSYQLHYMEMPYEEAQKEFMALFETHVCKEFDGVSREASPRTCLLRNLL
jgi:hypothetical protein